MRMPSKAYLEHLRSTYPKGSKVRLLSMDDVQAPPRGTLGTVIGVDDMGSIMVHWKTGSSLSVILEAGDSIEKVEE